jgi:hypothetical protein
MTIVFPLIPRTCARRLQRQAFLAGAVLAAVAISPSVHADTGVRVLAIDWNPRTPEMQQVRTLVDQPTGVSDVLRTAWAAARRPICDALTREMGKPRAAAGNTLRDIECHLSESIELAVTNVPYSNSVKATIAIPNMRLVATSTQDTIAGKYADPRFSVDVRAELDVILSGQPNPGEPVFVPKAVFRLQQARLDSQNVSGDVLKFLADELAPFFGGPNYKHLAENAINNVRVDVAGYFNRGLGPVNSVLAARPGLTRTNLFLRAERFTVAYAPPELAPPTDGAISGTVRWSPAEYSPSQGCASFLIKARVQTGANPLADANDTNRVVPGPQREIGMLRASPVGDAGCAFTLAGLAAGWPHTIIEELKGGGSAQTAGSLLYTARYVMTREGWGRTQVVPQPTLGERNYLVNRGFSATDTPAVGSTFQNPIDPVAQSDRLRDRVRPGTAVVSAPDAMSPATTVSAPANSASPATQVVTPASPVVAPASATTDASTPNTTIQTVSPVMNRRNRQTSDR